LLNAGAVLEISGLEDGIMNSEIELRDHVFVGPIAATG